MRKEPGSPDMEESQEGWKHPEQADDEAYMGNHTRDSANDVGWKTKRFGDTAYGKDRQPIDQTNFIEKTFPVFVKKSELEEAGVEPPQY